MRRKKIILVVMFPFVMAFSRSAWCSFNPTSYNFGWLYLESGTPACVPVIYTNDAGGGTICGENGCYTNPVPTRTVTFSQNGGFTATPSSADLAGYGSVNLNVCASLFSNEGNFSGTLTATYSPPYVVNGYSYNTENLNLQLKEINTLVTLEPLYANMAFGDILIGQYAEETINVCNYNTFPVTISSITSSSNYFTVVSGWNTVIQPLVNNNPSCNTVGIKFSPQAAQGYSATIDVNTSAQAGLTYACQGIGVTQLPPPPPSGPAFSLSVIPLLIAGVSGVLYWQGRKQKKGTISNNS